MSDTTRRIPMLAKAFLTATQRHMLQRRWRHSRNEMRRLLRCCRRPEYFATAAARLDLALILHLYGRVTDQRKTQAERTADGSPLATVGP